MPSVTNVNYVPPFFVTVSRAWLVSTNTGTRKGGSFPHHPSALGSSSHGPSPPLNMRLPVTKGPGRVEMFLDDICVGAELTARKPVALAPGQQADGPFVQPLATLSQRSLEARIRPGDEAVERGRDVESQFRHSSSSA